MSTTTLLGTRAVLRPINPGSTSVCAGGCGQWVIFRATKRANRVVANVYENGKWDRVEIWHARCYEQAGSPHGEARP